MALPCISNKKPLLLAQSSEPILYFKLYVKGLFDLGFFEPSVMGGGIVTSLLLLR